MAYKNTKARMRQLKRVRALIKSFKKRGFQFEVQTTLELRVLTKLSTVRLSKITPEYLYKRSKKIVDGKVVSGFRGRNIEYERRSQKAAQTRKRNRGIVPPKPPGGEPIPIPDESEVIIENFLNIIRQYDTWSSSFIQEAFNDMIKFYGTIAVAKGLERLPQGLKDRIVQFAYNSAEESESMTRAISSAMRAFEIIVTQMGSRDEMEDLMWQIAPWKRKRKGYRNPTGADMDWVKKIMEEMGDIV